jgi:undecaprenyl-diphosphatase
MPAKPADHHTGALLCRAGCIGIISEKEFLRMANARSTPTRATMSGSICARVEAYVPLIAMLVLLLLGAAIILLPFEYRVAITLGLLQGLSEFLPISSSAHLILAPWFFGWPDPGLTFDVALHVGTLIAVAIYFWRDWMILLRAAPHPRSPDGRLFWLLMLAALPGGIAGVLLDRYAEQTLRSPLLIAGTLSVMGVALFATDAWGRRARDLRDLRPIDAVLVGIAQALAIVPGVSRSGITIATARGRGIARADAARFSFLLGCPMILGAALYKLRDLAAEPNIISGPFLAGIATSALVGLLSISFMLRYLRQAGLGIFVLYRLLLAALVITTVLLGLR